MTWSTWWNVDTADEHRWHIVYNASREKEKKKTPVFTILTMCTEERHAEELEINSIWYSRQCLRTAISYRKSISSKLLADNTRMSGLISLVAQGQQFASHPLLSNALWMFLIWFQHLCRTAHNRWQLHYMHREEATCTSLSPDPGFLHI